MKLIVLSRLSVLLVAPALFAADDHWIALKSGPFEVFSNAGEKPAREKLMYLEQFRETLRVITGKDDLRMVWPVHVLVVKNASEIPATPRPFRLGRDARMFGTPEAGSFSRDSLKELARLILYENTNRLPESIEQGILELVSRVEIDGPRITIGASPPEAERTPGWALMHLVTTNPAYAGRTRVMISNLEQTNDFDAACRNAFEKPAAEIQKEAEAELKSGNLATSPISGRAIIMARDFKTVPLGQEQPRLELADLAYASGHTEEARKAYMALHGPEASEGLALILLDEQKDRDAGMPLQDAIDSKSASARAWLEFGRIHSDEDALKKASFLNPRWAEPYFQLADLDAAVDKAQLEKRAALLKKATDLEPRNMEYWQALAKTYEAAKDFAEAQKAWGGAERAAASDKEREKLHQVRLDLQATRFDEEAAERKRQREEQEADLARVKAQSEAAIHAAENAARKKMNPNGEAPPKPEAWYQASEAGASVQGVFQRLDCLNGSARFVVQTADGKTVQLLMGDPSQVSLAGGGEKTLACGAQKNPRQVVVRYTAQPDAKLHTAGVVTAIEFH